MSKSKTKAAKGLTKAQQTKVKASFAKGSTTLDKLQAALKGAGIPARRQKISSYLQKIKIGKRAPEGWISETRSYQKREQVTWKAAKKHILGGREYTQKRAKKSKAARKVPVRPKYTKYEQKPTMWQLGIIVDMKDEATGETRDGVEGFSKAHAQKNFSSAFDEAVSDAQAFCGGSNWYVTNVVSTEWIHYMKDPTK